MGRIGSTWGTKAPQWTSCGSLSSTPRRPSARAGLIHVLIRVKSQPREIGPSKIFPLTRRLCSGMSGRGGFRKRGMSIGAEPVERLRESRKKNRRRPPSLWRYPCAARPSYGISHRMHHALAAKIQQAQKNPSADLPTAIQRYLAGESIQVLAREFGVARATLYQWMLSDVGPEAWQALKRDALIQRIADADAEMEEAKTPLDIARARERMRFARMDYERRCPTLYGPRQHVDVASRVTVHVNPYVDLLSAPALSPDTPPEQNQEDAS